jgi:hypothetical protein
VIDLSDVEKAAEETGKESQAQQENSEPEDETMTDGDGDEE